MPELNALVINETTNEITIPSGATGWFIFWLDTDATLDVDVDKAVLGIGRRDGSSRPYSYTNSFRKDFPISRDGEGKLYVRVELTNADTRTLVPGKYYWDITIVTDPNLDDDGHVVVDENTDHVYPIYAGTGALPACTIMGGVPIV